MHLQKENQDLGMWVGHAARLFRRKVDQRVAEAVVDYDDSVSGRNVWVLKYLKDHEGEEVYQRDLEKNFKVRGSTVSNMIDLMEQKGLIARVASEKDARKKRLCLTEKAESVLAAVAETFRCFEEQLRGAFTPKDYDTFLSLLEHFCNTLEAIPEINNGKESEEKPCFK